MYLSVYFLLLNYKCKFFYIIFVFKFKDFIYFELGDHFPTPKVLPINANFNFCSTPDYENSFILFIIFLSISLKKINFPNKWSFILVPFINGKFGAWWLVYVLYMIIHFSESYIKPVKLSLCNHTISPRKSDRFENTADFISKDLNCW